MKKLSLVFAIGLLNLLSVNAYAAMIGVDSSTDANFLVIDISGPIISGDADSLAAYVERAHRNNVDPLNWLHINIDSTGGSVSEALKIGYFLRSQNAIIDVFGSKKSGVCESSCVFVLMSGVMRSDLIALARGSRYSGVAIHRPYLEDGKPGQNFEKSYRDLHTSLIQYFDYMHVSTALLDLMYSVPPEKLRVLTLNELNTLIPPTDPVYDEERTAGFSSIYHVSSAEYRRRELETKICNNLFYGRRISLNDFTFCRDEILKGKPLDKKFSKIGNANN